MKKFLVLVAALGALFYYKPELLPSFGKSGAFDAKGNPIVLVFTDKNCAPCDKALADLSARGVAFQEVHLAESEDNVKRYEKFGGNGLIPLLVIGRETLQGYDAAKMASVLGAAFGDRVLTQLEQMYYRNHFNSDGSPRIYMYGASWCVFCKAVREELGKRNIPFEEMDVDASSDKQLVQNTLDIGGYPLIYVGYTRIVGPKTVDPVLSVLKSATRHH